MDWTTGALGAATVLLALALGGVRGLLVAIALLLSCWLMRSTGSAQAAHQETHPQDADAQQCEAEREAEPEERWEESWRQAESDCGPGKWHQARSEHHPQQFEENDEWWNVLEVEPDASADEIRHAYRHKIKQCHPDRVIGLAPELLEAAERYTRTLNAAYSEANRVLRSASAAQ